MHQVGNQTRLQLTLSQNVESGDQHVAYRTEHDDKSHKQNDHPVLWFSYCRKEEASSKTKRWSMGRYIGWELSTVSSHVSSCELHSMVGDAVVVLLCWQRAACIIHIYYDAVFINVVQFNMSNWYVSCCVSISTCVTWYCGRLLDVDVLWQFFLFCLLVIITNIFHPQLHILFTDIQVIMLFGDHLC